MQSGSKLWNIAKKLFAHLKLLRSKGLCLCCVDILVVFRSGYLSGELKENGFGHALLQFSETEGIAEDNVVQDVITVLIAGKG